MLAIEDAVQHDLENNTSSCACLLLQGIFSSRRTSVVVVVVAANESAGTAITRHQKLINFNPRFVGKHRRDSQSYYSSLDSYST